MNKNIKLTIASSLAISMVASGCENQPSTQSWDDNQYASQDVAVCVNREGERIDDDYCEDNDGSHAYLWYYLGKNNTIPRYGQKVKSGSYNAPSKTASKNSAQRVTRGGFGGSARSSVSS